MKENLAYRYKIGFEAAGSVLVGRLSSGVRFRIDEASLARSLCALPARAADLYRIAMSVYAADRLSRRRFCAEGNSRARTIRLDIEVSQPDFWRSPDVQGVLLAALDQLSDDNWHLELSASGSRESQGFLDFPDSPVVCLYSGGLDSAAGLASRLRGGCGTVLAVTARHQPGQRLHVQNQLDKLRRHFRGELHSIMAKATLIDPPRWSEQERSQRCRSFLFTSLGGCVACVVNAHEVEIYENGIGVVNLPPMQGMLVGARATRGCHPQFLRLMSELVSRVAERSVSFVLPFREQTKAELVRVLDDEGLYSLAADTVSCVRYPRRVKGSAKQCGYCPACIGRRQALIASDVWDASDGYFVDLFGRADRVNRIPLRHLRYLRAMLKQLADFSIIRSQSDGTSSSLFRRHVLGTGISQCYESPDSIVDLMLRYQGEWQELLATGRKRGWNWAGWLPTSSAA